MQEVTTSIAKEVVLRTPVDTGYARGNWRPSLNAPATAPVTSLDPTGLGAIGKITNIARQHRLGDTIYIVNNASYIGLLNAGSSRQAPAGYVQAAVANGFTIGMGVARTKIKL